MTTKTRPKTTLPKAKNGPPLIVTKSVKGLHGRGVIRLGKESRLELRDRLQMTRGLFSRVVNVSERTLAKVEANAEGAAKLLRPYNEIYQLCEALGEVVDPQSLGSWFTTPNAGFGGLKPVEVIERGDSHRLWDLVFRLQSGMPG